MKSWIRRLWRWLFPLKEVLTMSRSALSAFRVGEEIRVSTGENGGYVGRIRKIDQLHGEITVIRT